MTDEQISHLIAARERITRTMPDYDAWVSAVDHIDAVLRDVLIGTRPDVDALLGRSPAQPPNREGKPVTHPTSMLTTPLGRIERDTLAVLRRMVQA